MKPITKSRNQREGHYAGRSNWSREFGRYQGPLRHVRTGQDGHSSSLREQIPPGGWYGDPLGGGWGDQ